MKRVHYIFVPVFLLMMMGITWLYWPALEPRLMPATLTVVGVTNQPSGSLKVTFRLHNGSRKTILYSFATIQYQDEKGHWDDDRPTASAVNSLKRGVSTTFQFYVAAKVKKARGAVDCQRQEQDMKTWRFRSRFGVNLPQRDSRTIYSPEVSRD
jgi:hypothetical protein